MGGMAASPSLASDLGSKGYKQEGEKLFANILLFQSLNRNRRRQLSVVNGHYCKSMLGPAEKSLNGEVSSGSKEVVFSP